MIQRNADLPVAAVSLARVLSAAAVGLCATLLACSGESLNMGEGLPVVEAPALPSSSRCLESPVLEGQVVVHNQEELDSLEGCEVIDGDLFVRPFEGAQLRALHALTAVSGLLTIGATAYEQYDVPEPPGPDAWQEQELNAAWLSSLEGLEALESAGTLTLNGLTSEDLEPLGNLTTLTDALYLWSAPNLKNFNGLQKLAELRMLSITGARQLENFDGLTLPSYVGNMDLTDVDLSQLKPLGVTAIGSLFLEDTQLHDLAAFASLRSANVIQIWGCQQLESLAGLENLEQLQYLELKYNGSLLEVPDFDKLYGLNGLRIIGSSQLARLPAFQNMQFRDQTYVPNQQDFILSRPDVIELDNLGSLTAFSLPASWLSAAVVKITNNASLRRVDFTGQSYVDYLSIQNNPLLESVSTGALDKVNVLEVVDNPRLSLTSFAGVRHLDVTASGNADAPSAAP